MEEDVDQNTVHTCQMELPTHRQIEMTKRDCACKYFLCT